VLRTPLRCSPCWAAIKIRPNRLQKTQPVAELKQLIADDPQLDCAAQRDRRGKEQPWPQPSRTQSPSVTPAKAGIQSQPKIIKTFAAVAIVTPSQIPFLTRRAAQPRRGYRRALFELRDRLRFCSLLGRVAEPPALASSAEAVAAGHCTPKGAAEGAFFFG
jgi:hypothetical protein